LLGEHQRLNAALAVATVSALQTKIPVSEAAIAEGLSTVQWPGRLQLVTRPDGQNILLDAAHNVAGAETLRAALKGAPGSDPARWSSSFSLSPSTLKRKLQPLDRADLEISAPIALILGILADKDWRAMCEILAPLAARIVTVPVGSERTASAGELAAACRAANSAADVIECGSFGEAMEKTSRDPFVVITGSLYLIGEALEWLGLSPEVGASERALNEWGGAKDDALNVPAR